MSDGLHVFCNDVEWVVAYDEDDCPKAMKESIGADSYEGVEWFQCPDDAELMIWIDELDLQPGDQGDRLVIGTMATWIEYNGRGFLCSTEY